ncbi:MAG: urea transporter [Bacteroidota bacterium]
MQKLNKLYPHFFYSIVNSYTQIYFSNNLVFGLLLMMVSFFDLWAGVSGLISVLISNILAYLIGFNRHNIRAGYYGFNSLLVGLGLGLFFQPSPEFFLVLGFASLTTLFITITLEGVIGKYALPYLSLPFLFAFWMVTLSSRQFTQLLVSERGIYQLNEMYAMGGQTMVNIYNMFNDLDLPWSLGIYFRSMGAIFFQYHLFPGLLITIGLLIHSRIAFLLSLTGFYSAFLYYHFVGLDFNQLNYSYIGFNFILSAIALGGFFVVASRYSFLWVILLTPLTSFLITSTSVLLSVYQLSIFALPFNVVVIIFLYVMKFREKSVLKPELVLFQQYSPEKNLYTQTNNKSRFKNTGYFPIFLPFFGEWVVTQAHDGEHTHQADWRHAWDFEIYDENNRPFADSGTKLEDYYCFDKPILAPADGWVIEVVDHVEDNAIGEVNTSQNWGNTIIIKHTEGLYSKISHLKQYSLKVNKGDFVYRGAVLASAGNSGRSPQPHIHFQLQATPHIGSKTLDYPLGIYMLHEKGNFSFKSYHKPKKDQVVSNLSHDSTLVKTFNFMPGQKLRFEVVSPESRKGQKFEWEIQTDILNNTFIYSHTSRSKAYFKNDGSVFYFTHFEGNRRSLLFTFYLAHFKLLLGFYKGMQVNDSMPPYELTNKALLVLQDFVAPFFRFVYNDFKLTYLNLDEGLDKSRIQLQSQVETRLGKFVVKKICFEIQISDDIISGFTILNHKERIEVKQVPEK